MTDQHFVTAEEEIQNDLDYQEHLQALADMEYEEFYKQEQERDNRAREIAEEAE